MIFDSHTHTTNSDGRNTVDEMCRAAIDVGVAGFMITDHADMNFYHERDTYHRIQTSVEQIHRAQDTYQQDLMLCCGVELGEYLFDPQSAEKILSLTDYDAVLCSIHFVPQGRWDKPYNRVPFDQEGTDAQLQEYLCQYLELLCDTIDGFDFQILAHLACPIRYMTSRHKRKTDIFVFEPKIRQILQKVIDRNIALEWNTASIPDNQRIFELYYSMGGRLVTIGSDAHAVNRIGGGVEETKALLKNCGFTHYQYYRKGIAQNISL